MPGWTTFPLRDRPTDQISFGEIFMDHYLVLLLQDSDRKSPQNDDLVGSENEEKPRNLELSTTLLAFDLGDKRVQEVKVDGSLFLGMQDCAYTKYRDNQIIKFGGPTNKLVRITIESFERIISQLFHSLIRSEALSVRCEEIKVEGEQPELHGHTAHIYNDYLYVYGKVNEKNRVQKDLWSFDLGKRCSLHPPLIP